MIEQKHSLLSPTSNHSIGENARQSRELLYTMYGEVVRESVATSFRALQKESGAISYDDGFLKNIVVSVRQAQQQFVQDLAKLGWMGLQPVFCSRYVDEQMGSLRRRYPHMRDETIIGTKVPSYLHLLHLYATSVLAAEEVMVLASEAAVDNSISEMSVFDGVSVSVAIPEEYFQYVSLADLAYKRLNRNVRPAPNLVEHMIQANTPLLKNIGLEKTNYAPSFMLCTNLQ